MVMHDVQNESLVFLYQLGTLSPLPSGEKEVSQTPHWSVAVCFFLVTPCNRVFAVVSTWAHSHGIRLLRYPDDWLDLSSSEREAKQAVQSLLRDCDKREEVGSHALVDCKVSRHDHRYRGRQGFSVSGASREIPDVCGELLYHGRSPSSALVGDSRSPGFARAAGPSRSPSDAHFTVASEGALVPRVRPSLSSSALATGTGREGRSLIPGAGLR